MWQSSGSDNPSYPRRALLFCACFFCSWPAALPAGAQNGLAAAFPCNEGAGTTVTDITAVHHVGTLSNAARTAQGKYGAGLTFNGANSWVTVPDHAPLDLTTGATVMAWVYPTERGGYRTAVTKETPGGAAYYLYSAPGDVAMGGGGCAGGNYHEIGGGAVLPLNTRAHLATTYDAARDRGYRR